MTLEFPQPLKKIGPVTYLVFLGLKINTVLIIYNTKMPQDKVQELKELLFILLDETKVKLKELE